MSCIYLQPLYNQICNVGNELAPIIIPAAAVILAYELRNKQNEIDQQEIQNNNILSDIDMKEKELNQLKNIYDGDSKNMNITLDQLENQLNLKRNEFKSLNKTYQELNDQQKIKKFLEKASEEEIEEYLIKLKKEQQKLIIKLNEKEEEYNNVKNSNQELINEIQDDNNYQQSVDDKLKKINTSFINITSIHKYIIDELQSNTQVTAKIIKYVKEIKTNQPIEHHTTKLETIKSASSYIEGLINIDQYLIQSWNDQFNEIDQLISNMKSKSLDRKSFKQAILDIHEIDENILMVFNNQTEYAENLSTELGIQINDDDVQNEHFHYFIANQLMLKSTLPEFNQLIQKIKNLKLELINSRNIAIEQLILSGINIPESYDQYQIIEKYIFSDNQFEDIQIELFFNIRSFQEELDSIDEKIKIIEVKFKTYDEILNDLNKQQELFQNNGVETYNKIHKQKDEVSSARLILQNFLSEENNDQEQVLDALKTLQFFTKDMTDIIGERANLAIETNQQLVIHENFNNELQEYQVELNEMFKESQNTYLEKIKEISINLINQLFENLDNLKFDVENLRKQFS